MTLFGRTFGPEEIFSLIFLLTALVLWLMAWRGERSWTHWFQRWESERKARRDAELSMEQDGQAPPRSSDGPRGPWG
ncbi:hypothetical protein [Brevundimonas lenta]|uniref:Uncharacterized protein n=1 Tax=Brevundimonas lenta TaxID=424796 RepID=A0A7W6JEM5_9CAUL|nr:hypothetical protein [Brevundimonas lenta]MBB4083706.1 hypothetical protein [Brevundimonas lenta]